MTCNVDFGNFCKINFNSHAHVERDMVSLTALHIKIISTHTLTWSVTRGADVIYRNAGHFNSHAHVERDAEVAKYAVKPGDFNSHAHVERDVYVFEGRLSVDISTHTLTWSVTQLSVSSQRQAYFNSHAHVERDRTRQAVYKDVVNFNSHAHVERDLKIIRTPRLRLKFQLTRSRGA